MHSLMMIALALLVEVREKLEVQDFRSAAQCVQGDCLHSSEEDSGRPSAGAMKARL